MERAAKRRTGREQWPTDTAGERKTTGEEVEWADPGAALKPRQAASGDTQVVSESWGCERRWDVDLGSAHHHGWSRSRHRAAIGPIEGGNPTSFLLQRTAWEGGKRTRNFKGDQAVSR